jgi:hypothetical protein
MQPRFMLKRSSGSELRGGVSRTRASDAVRGERQREREVTVVFDSALPGTSQEGFARERRGEEGGRSRCAAGERLTREGREGAELCLREGVTPGVGQG